MAIEDKELGIKIGSKIEDWWTKLKEKSEESIFHAEQEIIANKELVKLAERMIKENKL